MLSKTNLKDGSPRNLEARSILAELREKTGSYHRALEETSDIWPSLSSREAYAALLGKFSKVYGALEPPLAALAELPAWLPDVRERWKTSWLKMDLADLDVLTITAGAPHARVGGGAAEIAEPPTLAAAFGQMYVLEGSTLGGQMIARQVGEALGLSAENGCRFFSSYGANVGKMWKSFGERLELFGAAHPDCRAEITESAIRTFAMFSRTLSG